MRISSGFYITVFSMMLWAPCAWAFTWNTAPSRPVPIEHGKETTLHSSLHTEARSRLPNVYAVAMRELQELESEPLCHRIAARLLVNNCQLLDGKDEATVWTDSGREVRDFVDSYAASLAICDLERGSFAIPAGCSKFREAVLAMIPSSEQAHLHVSTREIDSCLSGLAKSDSAWNTWVSYRHKALRFCEAARADNEKAQSVRLYQRLTEVLSKLTEGVEAELEQYLQSVDSRLKDATQNLDHLGPRIDHLREGLGTLGNVLSANLLPVMKDSVTTAQGGLRDADTLRQLISGLLQTVIDNNAAATEFQDRALQTIQRRTDEGVSVVVDALAAAVASGASLQDQIEASRLQVAELATRQNHIEHGMDRLITLANQMTVNHESHAEMLGQAQSRTESILTTLAKASVSANIVHDSIRNRSVWASWWPYVVCPTASLMMGSYGLPPSAVRNLGLVALGELAGFIVTSTQRFPSGFWNIWVDDASHELHVDIATFQADGADFASTIPPDARRHNGTIRT